MQIKHRPKGKPEEDKAKNDDSSEAATRTIEGNKNEPTAGSHQPSEPSLFLLSEYSDDQSDDEGQAEEKQPASVNRESSSGEPA